MKQFTRCMWRVSRVVFYGDSLLLHKHRHYWHQATTADTQGALPQGHTAHRKLIYAIWWEISHNHTCTKTGPESIPSCNSASDEISTKLRMFRVTWKGRRLTVFQIGWRAVSRGHDAKLQESTQLRLRIAARQPSNRNNKNDEQRRVIISASARNSKVCYSLSRASDLHSSSACINPIPTFNQIWKSEK